MVVQAFFETDHKIRKKKHCVVLYVLGISNSYQPCYNLKMIWTLKTLFFSSRFYFYFQSFIQVLMDSFQSLCGIKALRIRASLDQNSAFNRTINPQGTYQEKPLEEFQSNTLAAKRYPGGEYTAYSANKPYNIQTTCCCIQLVYGGITHPKQHHASANKH